MEFFKHVTGYTLFGAGIILITGSLLYGALCVAIMVSITAIQGIKARNQKIKNLGQIIADKRKMIMDLSDMHSCERVKLFDEITDQKEIIKIYREGVAIQNVQIADQKAQIEILNGLISDQKQQIVLHS